MVQELIDLLIKDLDKIHQESRTHISEIDDEVLKTISVVKGSKVSSAATIKEVHLKLIFTYLDKIIQDAEKFIKDISKTFVNTKNYKMTLNGLKRERDELQRNIKFEKVNIDEAEFNKFFSQLNDLWNKTVSFSDELVDSEDDIRKDAWVKFIRWVYLPTLAIVAVIYGAYLKLNVFAPQTFWQIIWKSLAAAGVLFFLLQWAVKNWLFNQESSETEKSS